MNQKLRFLCFQGIHNSIPSFWAKLGYSQIKIDHIAGSLLKPQIKIGVHLINVELSQLLTLIDWKTLTELNCCWLENEDCWTSYYWTFCFGKSKKKQSLWSFLLHDLPRCLQKQLWNCLIFEIFHPEPARDYNVIKCP